MKMRERLRHSLAGGVPLSLRDFLFFCARPESAVAGQDHKRLLAQRRLFLQAGLRALEEARTPHWLQFNVQPAPGDPRSIAMFESLAHGLTDLAAAGRIQNFFFMQKPPGWRLRFEVSPEAGDAAEIIRERLQRMQTQGAIAAFTPAIYEPETLLFGGTASMAIVHELFTADSELWMRYHASPSFQASGPSWVLSLSLLRHLFAGLGITDWEDLDVWDRVRTRTGRRIDAAIAQDPEFRSVAAEIAQVWAQPDSQMASCPTQLQTLAAEAREKLAALGRKWQTKCSASEGTTIGPRAVAALFVIFHWNRAWLTAARQSLIVEALASRQTV